MENYLDRAANMSSISIGEFTSEIERYEDLDVAIDVGAKFIGRIGGWWANGPLTSFNDHLERIERNINYLKICRHKFRSSRK